MNKLLTVLVGSQAYGTNTPDSDFDYKGIYLQNLKEVVGYKYQPQIQISKDEAYFEIKRFLDLAETANPTILEVLYTPKDCIVFKDSSIDILFKNRDKFLTKKCGESFGGYALDQIKKAKGLDKKQNWEKHRTEKRTPMDFCYVVMDESTRIDDIKQGVYPLADWLRKNGVHEENVYVNKLNHTKEGYQLYYGKGGIMTKDGTKLKTPSSPPHARPIATIMFSVDAYKQHCRDYESYQQWLKERNTARYVDFEKHGQSYDGKNLLHCRRLIDMGFEIALEKTINVRRPNRDYLLSIRRGEVNLEDILKQAEEDIKKMEEVYQKCDLPDMVNPNLKEELLLNIRGL